MLQEIILEYCRSIIDSIVPLQAIVSVKIMQNSIVLWNRLDIHCSFQNREFSILSYSKSHSERASQNATRNQKWPLVTFAASSTAVAS